MSFVINSASSPNQKDTVNFFPSLPPYADPTIGFLSHIPSQLVPYGQLMRLDRLGGFYAFYFPYLIGLIYAACLHPRTPTLALLLRLALTFLILNIFLRGAACTWNDNVDQDFDRRVARCRHRPIARGAISTRQAHLFTIAQLIMCYYITSSLPGPCLPHAAVVVILFFIYALMKRITYYPQVVLGFPFAWAVFICVGALGLEPFGDHFKATLAIFTANILWTITYDTVYAHQDIADDEKAGVKGMALRFKKNTKTLATMLTFGQVLLLAICGAYAGFGFRYFVGTVCGVGIAMFYFIYRVNLKDPESCGRWFSNQFWMVGAASLIGLLAEYNTKLGLSG